MSSTESNIIVGPNLMCVRLQGSSISALASGICQGPVNSRGCIMSSDAMTSVGVSVAAIHALWSQMCSGAEHVLFDEAEFNEGLHGLGCKLSVEDQQRRLEKFSIAPNDRVDERRFSELVCACGVEVNSSLAEAARIDEESAGCGMKASHSVVEASKAKEAWLGICTDGDTPHCDEHEINAVLVALG